MSRYMDAGLFLDLFYVASAGQDKAFISTVEMVVDDAPTVDAVEVVRCRDCRAFGKSPWGHFRMGWCMIHGCHHGQDYYCASGKRRDAEVEG